MARIISKSGEVILLDDENYGDFARFVWRVRFDPKNGLPYAYRLVSIKGRHRRWFMHRAVLGIRPGNPQEVDHREVWATLDNRKGNLRLATRSQNNANRRLFKNNTTGYRGVYLDKKTGRYEASIRFNGKLLKIGRFDSAGDAAAAYVVEKSRLFGEFARVE